MWDKIKFWVRDTFGMSGLGSNDRSAVTWIIVYAVIGAILFSLSIYSLFYKTFF